MDKFDKNASILGIGYVPLFMPPNCAMSVEEIALCVINHVNNIELVRRCIWKPDPIFIIKDAQKHYDYIMWYSSGNPTHYFDLCVYHYLGYQLVGLMPKIDKAKERIIESYKDKHEDISECKIEIKSMALFDCNIKDRKFNLRPDLRLGLLEPDSDHEPLWLEGLRLNDEKCINEAKDYIKTNKPPITN